jgi:hypothetical protein
MQEVLTDFENRSGQTLAVQLSSLEIDIRNSSGLLYLSA